MQYLVVVSKTIISVQFQGKPYNVTIIQVYVPITNAEKAEVEWFYEDLQDLLELTAKKRCPFHQRVLECKSRKSRDTWSNRQVWLWSTELSTAKANSFTKRMHWSQHTPSSNNTRDDSTHGHHQMVNTKIRLIILFVAEDGETLYS